MTAKIISIETRRCCDCGKPLEEWERFRTNQTQFACSNCWTIRAKTELKTELSLPT